MSSAELDGGCFTLTWEIKNFRHLLKSEGAGAVLWSPIFKSEHTEESAWWRLEADHAVSFPNISFGLYLFKGRLELDGCEMSIISSCEEVALESNNWGWDFHIERDAILGEKRKSILPNDTLTLRCKMWEKTMKTREARITSVLHSGKHLWSIEKCIESTWNSDTRIEQDNFLLYISLKEKSEKGACTVTVRGIPGLDSCLSSFVDCKFSIQDGRGRVIENSRAFPFVSYVCDIEIYPEYNTSISFHMEFIVALQMNCQGPGSPSALGDYLLTIYREALHADATLKTEGKSFSAHKNILAARSPVFRAMFEKDDVSEGLSGVVDIVDVDGETVDRMLVFLYGDSLEALQWEEASALYYAADKYAVLPLKQKCSDILKAGLKEDNVCDALVLAGKHSDKELMKRIVDFIAEHEEVVSSSDWDKLESTNPLLASKTLRQLYLKKGQK